jgi:hypothetical protein
LICTHSKPTQVSEPSHRHDAGRGAQSEKRNDMFAQCFALLVNMIVWQLKGENGLLVASPF